MAEEVAKRYAIVTGANKGIGLGVVKQLASNGFTVILTARDEKRGLEAVEKLKDSGLAAGQVIFHQLDVANPATIAPLADFIKTQFGKLDVLVNNAGINGVSVDPDAFKAAVAAGAFIAAASLGAVEGGTVDWSNIMSETNELTEECLQINYYGAKKTAESLIPLLELSDSPRIVNVSSSMGKLSRMPDGWAKGVFTDAGNLTEEKIDEVLTEFLKDFKEGGPVESKGWPTFLPAYSVSKAAMNAYTRILAKMYPKFRINSVCPSFVTTDMTFNANGLSVEEGAASVVRLALLHNDVPTGLFFFQSEVTDF